MAKGHIAVLFLGLPDIMESEGYDRTSTALPADQVDLLRRVGEVAIHTVVVLSNGSSISVSEWDHDADAILECWLGGQASGSGAVDVLTGKVNPSGHLAETIAVELSDIPAQLNFPGEFQHVHYGRADTSATEVSTHESSGRLSLRSRPELHQLRLLQP
ncbi:beta-glucosidase [Cutibacterium acnes JCM 18920]|nr:beta-glucosidase [Cutibacterium acnes JCM 18920]